MAEFQIQDQHKTLTINGITFDVVVGDIETLSAGEEFAERLGEIDLKKVGATGYRTLKDEIYMTVDQVLGEGATARIVDGKPATVTGLVQLLVFVLREVTVDFGAAVEGLLTDLTETVAED